MDQKHNGANWLTEIMSNRPLIVGGLFLASYFVPVLILVAVPLAYVFKQKPEEEWEVSHFRYLIRTFWIALLWLIAIGILGTAFILLEPKMDSDPRIIALAAIFVIGAGLLIAFTGVRIILSLMKSSSRTPMPNPATWLF